MKLNSKTYGEITLIEDSCRLGMWIYFITSKDKPISKEHAIIICEKAGYGTVSVPDTFNGHQLKVRESLLY